MIHDIKSFLLYDDKDNWIGIEIGNVDFCSNISELPYTKKINTEKLLVSHNGERIIIKFDRNIAIHRTKEVCCNLDISGYDLYGIELMLREPIGKLDHITDYIEWRNSSSYNY
ncbi:hypothetical protein SDC9_201680 [bioreactor metagenome]|uniref:Uncharacterized protein n=1 Tax=bioreactor metagenome TaxID=1076179 RepID=A0A645IRK9_9ZZZZ